MDPNPNPLEVLFYLVGGFLALLSFLAVFRLFSIETTLKQILEDLRSDRASKMIVWYGKMVDAKLTPDQRASLDKWDAEKVGGGVRTSDWPGWAEVPGVGRRPF